MSPRLSPYNNVILWTTASCLSPPGSSTQALYWAGTSAGLRPIPTVWVYYTRLLFLYFPAFVGVHSCAFWIGKGQRGYVDFLVSFFSRSHVIFICRPPLFFFFILMKTALQVLTAGYQHRSPITGLRINYRPWTAGRKDADNTLKSDMDYLYGCAWQKLWLNYSWMTNKLWFISFSTMAHTPSQWPLTFILFLRFASVLRVTS